MKVLKWTLIYIKAQDEVLVLWPCGGMALLCSAPQVFVTLSWTLSTLTVKTESLSVKVVTAVTTCRDWSSPPGDSAAYGSSLTVPACHIHASLYLFCETETRDASAVKAAFSHWTITWCSNGFLFFRGSRVFLWMGTKCSGLNEAKVISISSPLAHIQFLVFRYLASTLFSPLLRSAFVVVLCYVTPLFVCVWLCVQAILWPHRLTSD